MGGLPRRVQARTGGARWHLHHSARRMPREREPAHLSSPGPGADGAGVRHGPGLRIALQPSHVGSLLPPLRLRVVASPLLRPRPVPRGDDGESGGVGPPGHGGRRWRDGAERSDRPRGLRDGGPVLGHPPGGHPQRRRAGQGGGRQRRPRRRHGSHRPDRHRRAAGRSVDEPVSVAGAGAAGRRRGPGPGVDLCRGSALGRGHRCAADGHPGLPRPPLRLAQSHRSWAVGSRGLGQRADRRRRAVSFTSQTEEINGGSMLVHGDNDDEDDDDDDDEEETLVC